MSRTLVLACSTATRPEPELPLQLEHAPWLSRAAWYANHCHRPAIETYDGPAWRVLRAHRARHGELPDVWVLSARYGLIPASEPIWACGTRMLDRHIDGEPVMEAMARGTHYALRARVVCERAGAAWVHHADLWRDLLLGHLLDVIDLYVVAGPDHRHVLDRWSRGVGYPHATGGVGEQIAALRRWLEADLRVEQRAA